MVTGHILTLLDCYEPVDYRLILPYSNDDYCRLILLSYLKMIEQQQSYDPKPVHLALVSS